MNNRTTTRTAAAAAAAIGAVVLGTTSGSAAPPSPPATQSGDEQRSAEGVAAQLSGLTAATENDADASAGIDALRDHTEHLAATTDIAAPRNTNGVFTPFAYPALTFGCGGNNLPLTTVIAAGTANGPNSTLGRNSEPGTLTFHATPSHPGTPLSSGVTVAWINMSTGRSGIDVLDDHTAFGRPSLSKTIDSGPGTVAASMWGTVGYPGAMCVMTPTVGLVEVPDAPMQTPPAHTPDAPAPGEPGPGAAPAPAQDDETAPSQPTRPEDADADG